MCIITPITDIKFTNMVLWKFVHCVIRNPIKVHLSAVGVVLCIEIIGRRIGTMRGERQGDSVIGRVEEVGEGIRVT